MKTAIATPDPDPERKPQSNVLSFSQGASNLYSSNPAQWNNYQQWYYPQHVLTEQRLREIIREELEAVSASASAKKLREIKKLLGQ